MSRRRTKWSRAWHDVRTAWHPRRTDPGPRMGDVSPGRTERLREVRMVSWRHACAVDALLAREAPDPMTVCDVRVRLGDWRAWRAHVLAGGSTPLCAWRGAAAARAMAWQALAAARRRGVPQGVGLAAAAAEILRGWYGAAAGVGA